MGDEPVQPPDAIASGFAALVESVRLEIRGVEQRLREDNRDLEQRLREDNQRVEDRVMTALQAFARSHATEHLEEATERADVHQRFLDFIKNAELEQARRDGILGVFRFALEVTAKHAPRLGWIAAGVGAAIGFATGTIRIGIGS